MVPISYNDDIICDDTSDTLDFIGWISECTSDIDYLLRRSGYFEYLWLFSYSDDNMFLRISSFIFCEKCDSRHVYAIWTTHCVR